MIDKIKTLFKEIYRPMPLENNFVDYNDYWKNRGFCAPSLVKAKIISKHIESGCKILDIGCGDGTLIDYLKNNNNPSEIIGIDISQNAVDYVNARGNKAFVIDVLSDEFSKFLAGKEFDYIIITEVLEHVQDAEKVILTIRDHLTKVAFVSIPNAGFISHRLRFLFGRFPNVMIQQHVKEHIRFWTFKDFIYWCNYFGYKVDDYFVSSGLYFKPLSFLEKIWPSLFAQQIVYKITYEKK